MLFQPTLGCFHHLPLPCVRLCLFTGPLGVSFLIFLRVRLCLCLGSRLPSVSRILCEILFPIPSCGLLFSYLYS